MERDFLYDSSSILNEEEEEVDDGSPTRDELDASTEQVKPDALLENGHVAMRLHKLLNRHARGSYDSGAYDRQKSRVHGKIGKGGRGRTGQLDRGDGVAHQDHRCPVDSGESG